VIAVHVQVLGTDGDAQLGGDDFDAALAAWLQQQLTSSSSSSSSQDTQKQLQQLQPEVLAKLLEAAEAAKCRLTEQQSTQIQLDAATASAAAAAAGQSLGQQQQQQVTVELTRQQMHAATAQLRQRLWSPLQALAEDCKLAYECEPSHIEQQLAGQTSLNQQQNSSNGSSSSSSSSNDSIDPYTPKPRKLTAVLLVGGATRMPIIQQGLQTLTGLKPRCAGGQWQLREG
jgi:molecular chaperone DnaK